MMLLSSKKSHIFFYSASLSLSKKTMPFRDTSYSLIHFASIVVIILIRLGLILRAVFNASLRSQ